MCCRDASYSVDQSGVSFLTIMMGRETNHPTTSVTMIPQMEHIFERLVMLSFCRTPSVSGAVHRVPTTLLFDVLIHCYEIHPVAETNTHFPFVLRIVM